MTVLRTANGVAVTNGVLEQCGLAIALNNQTLIGKLNKINDNFTFEAAKLIRNKIHLVLAQYDNNHTEFPVRMLNAGGVLVFTENNQPLGMMMLSSEKGLELGFGKVELQDLNAGLLTVQNDLDQELKNTLIDLLLIAESKEAFIRVLQNPNGQRDDLAVHLQQRLETVLNQHQAKINAVLALVETESTMESSFGRPHLNAYAIEAIKRAAVRELHEEIAAEIDGAPLTVNHFAVSVDDAVNRASATAYMRSLVPDAVKPKVSAKEFNKDFESTTCVVRYETTANLLNTLTTAPNADKVDCILVKPEAVSVEVTNPEKGFVQTRVGDRKVAGAGNQLTIALVCNRVFGVEAVPYQAALVSPENTALKI